MSTGLRCTSTSALQRRPQPSLQRGALVQRCSSSGGRARRRAVACSAAQQFVLYSRPDCPLCDGLKEKMQALIDRAAFMPSALSGATLEVRDISTNAAWQDEMYLSVPVLAALAPGGREVVLPRPQPRVSADRLEKHLDGALREAGLL
ncbi:MAG: hypothetical protein J3K34DRAFT_518009 [Monoraphidium minutum]|nr:MAG: hypothetical protein J3K34DRAFT_518009 [Monoraphidium minutum]